ncbi:MAG: hypothetical protein NUV47_01880 [Patescibacteria group bacterium]|nr:hypothetical protein [Patescibacteria group bacterium]
MTPEEILLNLIEQKKEIESVATRRFQMGIGSPYPKELKEIDEQIQEAEKRTGRPICFAKFDETPLTIRITEEEKVKNSDIKAHKQRQKQINEITEFENRLEGLSKVDSKKLYILKKLKDEWDIYPNKNRYTISQSKYWSWIREFGIDDFPQFENFLLSLKKEGLIDRFDFLPDYM